MRRLAVLAVTAAAGALLLACTSSNGPGGGSSSPASATAAAPDGVTTSVTRPAPTPTVSTTATRATATHASTPPVTRRRTTAPVHASPSPPPVGVPPGSGPLIALNPGHNGADGAHPAELSRLVPADHYGNTKPCETTGTNTNAGYPEHEFNWDVTLRVRALLQARGVRVILTRPNDSSFGPCVDERAAIANRAGAAAVISIHADGASAGGHGFHVCEDSRPPAGAAVAAQSHRLTVAVHDALVHGSGLSTSTYLGSNGYFPRTDLAGLNLAEQPATFLELGNMRNAGDAALQSSADGRQRVAAAVAAGILAYLGR